MTSEKANELVYVFLAEDYFFVGQLNSVSDDGVDVGKYFLPEFMVNAAEVHLLPCLSLDFVVEAVIFEYFIDREGAVDSGVFVLVP